MKIKVKYKMVKNIVEYYSNQKWINKNQILNLNHFEELNNLAKYLKKNLIFQEVYLLVCSKIHVSTGSVMDVEFRISKSQCTLFSISFQLINSQNLFVDTDDDDDVDETGLK
ncbi:hypothetical protein DERP_002418 [Dermatophagoides pteronyssinus]|uniref:Uncharacterized protein n=1 Tax=Dermatophagoides pteronyssinus TaxID=6956 RepID=A0ABQ8JHQ9_DERPT|nr:hypothetical protein DERP_002418 [Dermatophagoides pteronyssinus]